MRDTTLFDFKVIMLGALALFSVSAFLASYTSEYQVSLIYTKLNAERVSEYTNTEEFHRSLSSIAPTGTPISVQETADFERFKFKTCGGFLVPIIIREQLTKATMALRELMFIAIRTNRTLVLPQVGVSGIGLRASHHSLYIGDYFDIEALQKNDKLSMESFESFRQRQSNGLRVSVAFIRERKREQCTSSDEPIKHKHYDKKWVFERVRCLPKDRKSITDAVNELNSEFCNADSVGYIYRAKSYLSDHVSLPRLNFSPVLTAEADKFISDNLDSVPFLAVHWRAEKVKNDMMKCARYFLREIRAKMKELGITRVFFASDMSEHPYQKSASFHKSDSLVPVYKFFVKELEPVMYDVVKGGLPPRLRSDSGTSGIVDKLICVKADYFMGLQGHCSKHSSFTEDIAERREYLQKPSQLSSRGFKLGKWTE